MLSLLITALASTAIASMNCNAEKTAPCADCKANISVSCNNDTIKGFAQNSIQPETVIISIDNPKSGSVRFIEIPNNKTLDSLTKEKPLENDQKVIEELKKKKIKVGEKTKIDLVHFRLNEKTPIYTDAKMTGVVTVNFKKQSRMVASEGPADVAGGVGRAVQAEKAQ